MYNVRICFFALLVMSASVCGAQENSLGHYETRILPNGNEVREFVADDPMLANHLAKILVEADLEGAERNGTAAIVDHFSTADLNALSDVEVLSDQSSEIKRLVQAYNLKIVGKTVGEIDKLKLETAREIESILLPIQLAEIARKTDRRRRLLAPLVFSSPGKEFNITDVQKRAIIKKAERANEIIRKAIRDIEASKKRCREELLSIYDQVLSEEQKKVISKSLDVDLLVERMELNDLEDDTNLKIPKGRD